MHHGLPGSGLLALTQAGPASSRRPGCRRPPTAGAPAATWPSCRPRSSTSSRAAYGDATDHIFLISAGIAAVGVVAALLLKPIALRTTVDLVRPGSAERAEATVADQART